MSAPVLEARGIRARYGSVEALHGVDVIVGRGRLVALLGGNGAGKTTLLLIDEPSLGLAPMLTRELFATFNTVRTEWDTSILLAEQNASLSLSVADDVVALAGGRVALSGPVEQFRDGTAIRDVYLGNLDPKAEAEQ